MRISEAFTVTAPPEAVFDYMVEPGNLREWQMSRV
jgi:uncharacterized protein YndB with AHSA1/START domain